MDKHFKEAVKALVQSEKSSGNFWTNLVAFAHPLEKQKASLAEAFTRNEAEFFSSNKGEKRLTDIGAYRSAKSVITNAVKHSIPLMLDGQVRGKTELEKLIKEARGDKPAIDKFKGALKTATDLSDKFEDEQDYTSAFLAAKDLTDKLHKRLTEIREGKAAPATAPASAETEEEATA